MIVKCPNCSTRYNFEDSRFRDELKVRCTRCEHVFKLSDLDQEEFASGLPSDDFSAAEKKNREKQKQPGPAWDPGDVFADPEPALAEPPERLRPARKKVMAVGAVIIIILGFLLVLAKFDTGIYIPIITPKGESEPTRQHAEFAEEEIKDISLENIRQYFIDNDKIGRLFVIEGQAVNKFNVPKSMIRLKASLYDAHGSVVGEKDFLCGNLASLFQLQVSSEEELETILQSRLGILTTNKHVEPGGYAPFMVVFYNPPEEMQEFGIQVIEAQNPVP